MATYIDEVATNERRNSAFDALRACGAKWSSAAATVQVSDARDVHKSLPPIVAKLNNEINNVSVMRDETKRLVAARDAVALYWAVYHQ